MASTKTGFLLSGALLLSAVLILCLAEDSLVDNGHNNLAQSNSNDNQGHSNQSQNHGNKSHDEEHGGHGVHVVGWNFDYVKTPFFISVFITLALLAKLGFHHADTLSKIMPESCMLIILGTAVGAVAYAATDEQITMSTKTFFLYLLPPIILESSYSLHDRVFGDNLGTILLYAVVGTLLNCFLIGFTLYGLAEGGAMGSIKITMIECLVFSSLIIAVDPVAVLAIFQEVGVNNTLYFLVFGESLLNDAVTVVIYNMMKAFNQMDNIPVTEVLKGVASFFTVSLCGFGIGIIYGVLTALTTKYTKHVRVVEPLAMFIYAYTAYLTAELFHFSGIISCIGCGLLQAHYAFHNISNKSQTTVKYFSKMASATCDVIIFLFLGLSMVRDSHEWHTGFVGWTVLLCLVYRFIVTFGLTYLANKRRKRNINGVEQFIMAYGGLRGAVSFSLVAMISKADLALQPMFLTTALVVILFTVFVQGMTIKPLVNLLKVTREKQQSIRLIEEIHNHVTDHILAGVEEICGHTGENTLREYMDHLDDKYLKKWLMVNPMWKDQAIMDLYKNMTLQQHYDAIGAKGSALSQEVAPTVQPKKPEIDNETLSKSPDMMYAHHGSRAPASRKRGLFARLRRRSPEDATSTTSHEPQVQDVRELLRGGATREAFHQKRDRNLKHEDKTDLMYQLHEKQLRRNRYNVVRSASKIESRPIYKPSVVRSRSLDPTPEHPMESDTKDRNLSSVQSESEKLPLLTKVISETDKNKTTDQTDGRQKPTNAKESEEKPNRYRGVGQGKSGSLLHRQDAQQDPTSPSVTGAEPTYPTQSSDSAYPLEVIKPKSGERSPIGDPNRDSQV